jgi:hypothetical protein
MLMAICLTQCVNDDKRIGELGASKSIKESRLNNLFISAYIPNEFHFKLFDGSVVIIDTAWAECLWVFNKESKPQKTDSIGYNFVIPIIKQDFDDYKFSFSALDKSIFSTTKALESDK